MDLSAQQNITPNRQKIETLTNREREVTRLIGEGLNSRQIAERLSISDATVHCHLTSIYSKLKVKNRIELIVYAYRNHLADVPH